jgi:hypothetical protein
MITVLAANDFGDDLGDGVAGPIGLLIIVLLVIGTIFLLRSMNKHLKRVPAEFPDLTKPGSDAPTARTEDAASTTDGDVSPGAASLDASQDGNAARAAGDSGR